MTEWTVPTNLEMCKASRRWTKVSRRRSVKWKVLNVYGKGAYELKADLADEGLVFERQRYEVLSL